MITKCFLEMKYLERFSVGQAVFKSVPYNFLTLSFPRANWFCQQCPLCSLSSLQLVAGP